MLISRYICIYVEVRGEMAEYEWGAASSDSHILACIFMSECRAAATPGLSLPSVVTSAIVGEGLQCQDIYQTEGPPHTGPTVRPLDATQPLRFTSPVVFLFSFYLQCVQHNLSLTKSFLLNLDHNIVTIFVIKLDFLKKWNAMPLLISQLIITTLMAFF